MGNPEKLAAWTQEEGQSNMGNPEKLADRVHKRKGNQTWAIQRNLHSTQEEGQSNMGNPEKLAA